MRPPTDSIVSSKLSRNCGGILWGPCIKNSGFEALDSCLFRREADVAIALQHLAADMACKRADGFFRHCSILRKSRDEAMPAIVPPVAERGGPERIAPSFFPFTHR